MGVEVEVGRLAIVDNDAVPNRDGWTNHIRRRRDVEAFAEESGLRRDGDQADRRYWVDLIIENRGWVGCGQGNEMALLESIGGYNPLGAKLVTEEGVVVAFDAACRESGVR